MIVDLVRPKRHNWEQWFEGETFVEGKWMLPIEKYDFWLVCWNMFYDFPFSWECHHPNCRTHIFQRGRYTTNQLTIIISFSEGLITISNHNHHWGKPYITIYNHI